MSKQDQKEIYLEGFFTTQDSAEFEKQHPCNNEGYHESKFVPYSKWDQQIIDKGSPSRMAIYKITPKSK